MERIVASPSHFLPHLIAVAVLLMTGFVAIGPPSPVSADGPTLSVPQTVIKTTDDTVTTVLSWNLGTIPAVDFRVLLPGDVEVSLGILTSNGSAQTGPLAVGQSYTWTLYEVKDGQTLKNSIWSQVTVSVQKLERAACVLGNQAISNVSITPHGTEAIFSFATSQPHLVTVEISKQAPHKLADGTYKYETGQPIESFALLPGASTHTKTMTGLIPKTPYHYLINAAKGSCGNDAQYTGETQEAKTFTTLRRQVTVHFNDIKVIDDSDDLSPGELAFSFSINGAWDFSLDYGTYVNVSTGDTLHPTKTKVILDAPDVLPLKVFGMDDDQDFIGSLCIHPPFTDHGSDDCWDWATASGSVSTTPKASGEGFTDSLSIETKQYALQFRVTGTYTVAYV